MSASPDHDAAGSVAVIGMAGRFPRARNVAAFWANIRAGVDCISSFTNDELERAGLDPALVRHPQYVKAKGTLDDIELFDAAFFGYTPNEARVMDPQQRLFLECGFEALENAGYAGEFRGAIGVYAGASLSTYLLQNLPSHPEMLHFVGFDKDFLATRLSYKLNLTGPSVVVQTACSTSLVAVCQAAQALLTFQCDVALAGGVSVSTPGRAGYVHAPGAIFSPDGRCRAFDAAAQGIVPGNGVGIVVLKRLEEAIADGDRIHAVIRGFAVNNDGAGKIGYTAPGVDGQAQAVLMAQSLAGIDARTIGYVEAHGTGTELGDPVEISALTQAFRASTADSGFCAIGSVKSNVGHLDVAAGVASLIKAVHAVRDGEVPPTLYCEQPNPRIDFAQSPFVVSTSLTPWPAGFAKRRAGVSSFGIGGTNAHVVIEEPPPVPASGPSRVCQVLTLSARTASALDALSASVADHLDSHPDQNLADAAFTLQVGRKRFPHRRAVVCRDREEAVAALRTRDTQRVLDAVGQDGSRAVAFVFPAAEADAAIDARELYSAEPEFRRAFDECRVAVLSEAAVDVASSGGDFQVFALDYALARMWMSWGVQPKAMAGEGAGEYVAACLTGSLDLRQAIRALGRGDALSGTPGAGGAASLYTQGLRVFLEIGPARKDSSSSTRALMAAEGAGPPIVVSALPPRSEPASQLEWTARIVAALWIEGVAFDWGAYSKHERRLRVELPTYPFERQRFWLEPRSVPSTAAKPRAARSLDDWFYQPVWRRSIPPQDTAATADAVMLVFADDEIAPALVASAETRGGRVVTVRRGKAFHRATAHSYEIAPGSADDYDRLASALASTSLLPQTIVHLWTIGARRAAAADSTAAHESAFYSLMYLARSLSRHRGFETSRLVVFTRGAQDVTGSEPVDAAAAMVQGICRVLPQEYSGLRCRTVDLGVDGAGRIAVERLLDEIASDLPDVSIAYRGGSRWTQSFDPLPLPARRPARLKDHGVYLITGGLGSIGLAIADYLARAFRARLVLTARTALPPRSEWPRHASDGDAVGRRVLAIQALEDAGAEVIVATADVTDAAAMRALLEETDRRFGALDGVIHAAGFLAPEGFRPIRDLTPAVCEQHFAPKVDGLLALERLLAGRALDFCLVMSSLSAQLGGVGYAPYASANAFMDAFANNRRASGDTRWVSVSWDGWSTEETTTSRAAMTHRQGVEALTRVLAVDGLSHVVVSAADLGERIAQWVTMAAVHAADDRAVRAETLQPRPSLKNQYVAPATELEQRIAAVWRELLGIDPIGATDSFFELGGDSLRGLQVTARLNRELSLDLSPVSLYEAPSVSALASFIENEGGRQQAAEPGRLRGERRREAATAAATRTEDVQPLVTVSGGGPEELSAMSQSPQSTRADRSGIAIVGMAGRFPGANDIETFWQNLKAGVESRTVLSDEELLAAGNHPVALQHPKFVRSVFVLDDVERFDSAFFGINPREADLLDPQHRLFLETCWQAIEQAGYDPEAFPGSVGVFGGATLGSYLTSNVYRNAEVVKSVGARAAIFGSVPDYMVTRVAYKLNLRGPAYFIQSACSTSLVAVHLGCQSLMNHECDMVLAGGVSAPVPQRSGYLYEEGGMLSPDGVCRTFDANARGTVFGSGVGVVLLKRLADAIADGDTIHAVVKGSASNNDGSLKVGFTAPGVVGQARVVAEAIGAAGVPAETVGYIEAHGTGTELGDPIEIAALTRAYGGGDARRNSVAIGSVKPNIGHLDAAAGVSSLIKTVMALKNRQIPPTINYERPNPKIDFENSPFYVSTDLKAWPNGNGPRRAGVSSFGFGGTNAHLIVEEAPGAEPASPSRAHQLLVISARTESALEAATSRLCDDLQRQPQTAIADAAYTLGVGRRPFGWRRAVVCRDRGEAIELLQGGDLRRVSTAQVAVKDRPVVFMFPGQGAQHVGMARGLYEEEAVVREAIDECADYLLPELAVDIREVLFGDAADAERLKQTSMTQPALFVVEYALSRLWMSWGIRPAAMIGHSIGELVAACLAGVFTLENALKLVAIRGRLMEQMPAGTMAAVPLSADRVTSALGPDLWLAAVNAPSLCVVSGQPHAVDGFIEARSREGIDCRRLHTSHAFHSGLMQAAVAAFTDAVRAASPASPNLPFISNVTGKWITAAQATDPEYWGRHILQPVLFAEGIAELLTDETRVLLEVGPGTTLAGLVRQQGRAGSHLIVSSLPHPNDPTPDRAAMIGALGRLWTAGSTVDWTEYYARERRRRVPLPTYPFERTRHWIEPEPFSRKKSIERLGGMMSSDLSDWFHTVSWKRSVAPNPKLQTAAAGSACLVFEDGSPLAERVAARIAAAGYRALRVRPGDGFARAAADVWTVSPDRAAYAALLKDLRQAGGVPETVVHAWSLTGRPDVAPDDATIDRHQQHGFFSLMYFAQAIGDAGLSAPIKLAVLTDGVHEVIGDEAIVPEKATIIGPCRVAPMEFANLTCRHIDLAVAEIASMSDDELDVILADALAGSREFSLAYRRGRRYVQGYEAARLEPVPDGTSPRLRDRGVYLITGGFGGIGLVLAEYLATAVKARLVLTARKPLPPRQTWAEYVTSHGPNDAVRKRIEAVEKLEALGAEVLIGEADAADEASMRAVVQQARARFGGVDGVVHSAGIAGGGMIQLKTAKVAGDVLGPKLYGARILSRIFEEQPLDFMLFCSSLTAVVGGVGQIDYCGANACLDAFARQFASRTGTFAVAVNWNAWREVGMAVDTNVPEDLRQSLKGTMLATGITNRDGVDAFRRILARSTERQVAIMPNDLGLLFQAAMLPTEDAPRSAAAVVAEESAGGKTHSAAAATAHARPALQTPYVAPRNETEQKIAAVWQELIGIDRVGINDNFFELGGHSLLAIRVMARINEVLRADIPVARLYDGLTVAFLAGIAGGSAHSAPAVEEIDEEDDDRRRDRARRQREQQARRRGAMRETSRT